MNFKEFIFTEEINPDDTATVYHRTKSLSTVSDILQSGFTPGGGAFYGKGLYTTISLESQFNQGMLNYGTIIVKFQVTNLDKYLVFHPNIAKRIYGQNYKLSDQLKKFGLDHKFQPEYLSELDQQQELTGRTNAENLRNFYRSNQWIQNDPAIKGVIYFGSQDGYCLLKYEPVNDGTITMLAYVEAGTSPEMMQKLYNNEGWITSTDKAKIKDIQKLPYEQREKYIKLSIINKEKLTNPNRLKLFLRSGKSLPINFIDYIMVRSDDPDKIANIFIKEKKDLNYKEIVKMTYYVKNKFELVKHFIKNKNDFSNDDLSFIFYNSRENMLDLAKIILPNLNADQVIKMIQYAYVDDEEELTKFCLNGSNFTVSQAITLLYTVNRENKTKIANLIIEKYPQYEEMVQFSLQRILSNRMRI